MSRFDRAVPPISYYTSYAVASPPGGLEGRRPSKLLLFWPLSATTVADSGQKGDFEGGRVPAGRIPRTPTA